MEQETIIYYYPVKENTGQDCAVAKKHWWQEAKLTASCLPESNYSQKKKTGQQDYDGSACEFHIYACPVPVFYYRKKNWQPRTLCEEMEAVLYRAEGMTDTFLAPGMDKLMPKEMQRKWHPRMETIKRLTACQLAQRIEEQGRYPQKAVICLGKIQDADWQMEMTWELLQPYLPKINQCVIRYEPVPGMEIREELGSFLEEYYYEYGLVVQTEKYGVRNNGAAASCEQRESSALCLDFRKDNLYRSCLKYLDTMVKNRYYKLVK